MIAKLDNIKYDISTTKNYLKFAGTRTVNKGSSYSFVTDKNIGYAEALLYKITIVNGIKHSVDDYHYKDLLVLEVDEIYKDTDLNEYVRHKKINLGAYVREKMKSCMVDHLTYGNQGQLVQIKCKIVNNSSFDIVVSDAKIYKAMNYSNTYILGDNKGQTPEQPDGTFEEVVDFERTEPFIVFYKYLYTEGNGAGNFDGIKKEGDPNIWATDSYFHISNTVRLNSGRYVNGVQGVWTDKNVQCPEVEDGVYKIPAYTEYIYVKYHDMDVDEYGFYYMNAMGLKYGGSCPKHHSTFRFENKFINTSFIHIQTGLKYTGAFNSRMIEFEVGMLNKEPIGLRDILIDEEKVKLPMRRESFNQLKSSDDFDIETDKYHMFDNKNFTGILKLYLDVQDMNTGEVVSKAFLIGLHPWYISYFDEDGNPSPYIYYGTHNQSLGISSEPIQVMLDNTKVWLWVSGNLYGMQWEAKDENGNIYTYNAGNESIGKSALKEFTNTGDYATNISTNIQSSPVEKIIQRYFADTLAKALIYEPVAIEDKLFDAEEVNTK